MKRRSALKQMGILSAATLVLPYCSFRDAQAKLSLSRIPLTANEEAVLELLSELIIPTSPNAPGASALDLYSFPLTFSNSIPLREKVDNFSLGLQQLVRAADLLVEEKSFVDVAKAAAPETVPVPFTDFLSALEADEVVAPELTDEEGKLIVQVNHVNTFYQRFRGLLAWGFQRSQYVMETVHGYKHVPGKFIGEVEITASTDIKTLLS